VKEDTLRREIRCKRRDVAAKGETLRKPRKARKFTVLFEIRANFESSGEFRDVSFKFFVEE
jgi:hypothetical protein